MLIPMPIGANGIESSRMSAKKNPEFVRVHERWRMASIGLKNRCCHHLSELRWELRRAKERLRHKRDIIQARSLQCGYSI
jgi:hypothetical protein